MINKCDNECSIKYAKLGNSRPLPECSFRHSVNPRASDSARLVAPELSCHSRIDFVLNCKKIPSPLFS